VAKQLSMEIFYILYSKIEGSTTLCDTKNALLEVNRNNDTKIISSITVDSYADAEKIYNSLIESDIDFDTIEEIPIEVLKLDNSVKKNRN
jgi:hypothetical protein